MIIRDELFVVRIASSAQTTNSQRNATLMPLVLCSVLLVAGRKRKKLVFCESTGAKKKPGRLSVQRDLRALRLGRRADWLARRLPCVFLETVPRTRL